MDSKEKGAVLKRPGRRQFLKGSAALAGVAIGGGMRSLSGQTREPRVLPDDRTQLSYYGVPSRFETTIRETVPAQAQFMAAGLTPLQDQLGIITPSALHFYNIRFHTFPPSIDPRQHRLLIHGLVERPLSFTLEELKRLPAVSRIHFIECHGNTSWPGGLHNGFRTLQQSHGKTSCSEWTGVLVSTLLREAGVKKEGRWILAESVDAGRHIKCVAMEAAMEECLVAYGQNGEAVRPEQGYPIRLVFPGSVGINNVKHLGRIKVVDEPYMFRWEYTERHQNLAGKSLWYNFQLGPKSVITRPSSGQRLHGPGYYEISGLAWAGGGAVRKVDVSTDGGRSWKEAKLHEPVLRKAHTKFSLDWTWDGQETVLESRCTDEHGDVQPSLPEFARIWGVNPDNFRPEKSSAFNVNVIQPWKVTREGSVENALLG